MKKVELELQNINFRKDLYPRFKSDPKRIQEYAENLEQLPPIEVSESGILIDGYHRLKAYQTANATTIPCYITKVSSELESFKLSVKRNAKHGEQLTQKEKKRYCILWFDQLPKKEIKNILSISERTFRDWTENKRREIEEQKDQTILDMYLRCYTQQEIADTVDYPQHTISRKISENIQNGKFADSDIFRYFEPCVYETWNFGKATNETRVFGNIPPEIIDNLLYYYTKPFNIVFDPFGGSGTTLDKCLERYRRCYISDLTPIPSRDNEIVQHDITTGLPKNFPSPDLVFLDPPYWQQAKNKYSNKDTDLSNIDLENFLEYIGNIAKQIKQKWINNKKENGILVLIMGKWRQPTKKIDLPFLCYEKIKKYLPLIERINVPYPTQIHTGAFVKKAKEQKEILYLNRDMMVFKWDLKKDWQKLNNSSKK